MDEELKKIARKQKSIPSQNCQSKIKNRQKKQKNTLYQFTKRNSNTIKIKAIIQRKMDSRKIDYDRLKNKLYIRKIQQKRRTIIEQRLLQPHIFLLNLPIEIKHDAELKNNAKTKRNSKNTPYEISLQRQHPHRRKSKTNFQDS